MIVARMTYDTIDDAVTMQLGTAGTFLANRYRIIRQLGQGGMGSVWLAEDTQLDNKQFAIKMLPSILVSNKRAYGQLKDEALVAMKLTHPNIVTLRAFEENNGNPFLVMDYVDGQTLDDYLYEKHRAEGGKRRVDGGLPEAEVVRLLKPIAAALDYAHAKGIVHRDVKPGNVIIAKDGTPYILDFGIAREIQETMTRVTGKLSSGTLLYMSPEQLNGEPPKPAQDIYSFAAMAYECLKGEPPFVRGVIEDQIKNKTPGQLGPHVMIGGRVLQALAKRPESRPLSCVAVLGGDYGKDGRKGGVRNAGGSWWLLPTLMLAAIVVAAYLARRTDEFQTNDVRHVSVVTECCTNAESTNVSGPTNSMPVAAKTEPLPSPERESVQEPKPAPEPKPVPEPRPKAEPAKPDPEFVKMTNRIAEAMAKLGREYGRANRFRASPRGFEGRLGEIENIWKSRDQGVVPSSMDEARDVLAKISNNASKISKHVEAMQRGEDRRREALEKEREFFGWLNGVRGNDASLYARVEGKSRWKGELAKAESLTNGINRGEFEAVGGKFDKVKRAMGEILADERTAIANMRKLHREREFLKQLDKSGFILDREREPRRPAGTPGKLRLPNGEDMDMVWCPPGWFMMGSPDGEMGRDGSEGVESRHGVQITKGFWIGKYEVTGGQWNAVMGKSPENRSEADSGFLQRFVNSYNSGRKPVTHVSHDQCEEFCRRLPGESGAGLPTEAEWEYACRAGTQTPYSLGRYATGKIINRDMANVETLSGFMEAVGHYQAYGNLWGICDMHGNVREWCADGYGAFANVDSLSVDPLVKSGMSAHVVRGGACNESLDRCRCAARSSGKADQYTGFRIRCYNLP